MKKKDTKYNISSKETYKKLLTNFLCPICKSGALEKNRKNIILCKNKNCLSRFPVVDNVPILINEKNSLFKINNFKLKKKTTFKFKNSLLRKILKRLVPSISANIYSKQNFARLRKLLSSRKSVNKLLVVGAGIDSFQLEKFDKFESIHVTYSDVSFGPRNDVICDAHDLPFKDSTFDAVVCTAVLEHVIDPYRCVDEIYRVLKSKGIIYVETPFMQQVHMPPYDFNRFTFLGHRKLLRRFEEIESGVTCGPGMALAWSYRYFMLSFFESKFLRNLINIFTSYTSFFLKYFDIYLVNKNGSFDAASGFFFIGRKSKKIISDAQILKLYKG